ANISAVFGDAVGKAFDPLWKKHIDFFVAYIEGIGDHDGARSTQALSDLAQYTKEFGAFINSILPALPADTVAGLAAGVVQALKAVIDGQAAGNETDAFTSERAAAAQI